jgi:hypothetical protein
LAVEEHDGRRGVDVEFLEGRGADLIAAVGAVEDEIRIQEVLELGGGVKLLTQQFTGPSATRVEIEKDQLLFGLGLGDGLVESALEPGLGRGGGREDENRESDQRFFHFQPSPCSFQPRK